MNLRTRTLGIMALLAGLVAGPALATDLREAVPNDCYLAVWSKQNPERNYQRAYEQAVWDTIEETKIVERFFSALRGQMSDAEAEQFQQVQRVLSNALEPIDWEALGNTSESVYAQKMDAPYSQHLLMLRVPGEGADSLVEGISNLFQLIGQMSNGQVPTATETIAGVEFSTLELPPQVPMRPYIGVLDGEIFVFSTSADMLSEALELMKNPSAKSRFDDERVAKALAKLPEAEDALTFFDGELLFEQLGGIPAFIRQVSNGDPDADRIAGFIAEMLDQCAIIDYEVTVEYTNKFQNRTAAFGELTADAGDKMLGKMVAQAEPFENWNRWVPANASSYSLSSGVNLYPMYMWIMESLPEHFPEAGQGLERFAAMQQQIGVDIGNDILKSFSGESVSLAFPGTSPGPLGAPADQSVMFLRCTNPDRIRELMHRGVEALKQIPDVQQQGLEMKPVEGLEGFEEVSVNMMAMMGVKPVVGFHKGWMVIGSDAGAVKTALETQSGSGDTVIDTEGFQAFDLGVRGTVSSISYENTGDNTRALAQGLQQAGALIPMMMGMAGQNGADLSKAQDFLALLPSVGKIIEKMDYYEKTISVVQPGEGRSYMRHSVTLIRPPAE